MEFEPFEYEKVDNTLFNIEKLNGDVYEVTGPLVETLVKNITLDDIDSYNYFQKQIKVRGVIDRLYQAGAKQGDTIIMGEVEFEFII